MTLHDPKWSRDIRMERLLTSKLYSSLEAIITLYITRHTHYLYDINLAIVILGTEMRFEKKVFEIKS